MYESTAERSYLELLRYIRRNGQFRPNTRSGNTFGIFDARIVADLRDGFPLLTTKKIPFMSIIAELLGFLRGFDSAAQFRELGTHIWDANANETPAWLANPSRKGEDDLGRIYGVQWRDWGGVDQIRRLLEGLTKDPLGRRHIVSAWNVDELHMMALPPCHVLFQCYVETSRDGKRPHVLHLKMTQRSADLFLGVPFNLASYATLLQMIAMAVGYEAGRVTIDMGDVHIYEDHLPQVDEQLSREPRLPPKLHIDARWLDLAGRFPEGDFAEAFIKTEPEAFQLNGYHPWPALPAKMAA
jgi:thymidylate synthase